MYTDIPMPTEDDAEYKQKFKPAKSPALISSNNILQCVCVDQQELEQEASIFYG